MRYIQLIGWWIHVLIVRCKKYCDGPDHPYIDVCIGQPEHTPMTRQLTLDGGWVYAHNEHTDPEPEEDDYVLPVGMQRLFHSIVSPPTLRRDSVLQYNFAGQAVPTTMIPKHPRDVAQEVREYHVSPIGMASLFQL